ncbi:hypothetical protein [Tabrizicola sp.]|uniref:hypothetical protein n=1 Tax=Tabrizicola sp. TaxID=2005166 RepID=UPI0025FBED55|nr:hypothetical protein [Tabrizicola sp.]
MTTIITRLYPDLATAQRVVAALEANGHMPATIDIITKASGVASETRMIDARVPSASAAAYAPGIAKGAALVVVRAPFAPLGAARDAMKVVNRTAAIDVGIEDEDHYIREQPRVDISGKVLQGTVFFMSNPFKPLRHDHVLGSNPILPAKPRTSAIRGGAYMSTKFWPMKLISTNRQANSAISGGFLFSKLFGIPLLIRDLPSREILPTKI